VVPHLRQRVGHRRRRHPPPAVRFTRRPVDRLLARSSPPPAMMAELIDDGRSLVDVRAEDWGEARVGCRVIHGSEDGAAILGRPELCFLHCICMHSCMVCGCELLLHVAVM
jgi:hypothetical protein